MKRLGVDVSIVDRNERLLHREDAELSLMLTETLRNEGVQMSLGATAKRFSRSGEQVSLVIETAAGGEETLTADTVLVAVGRVPNLEGLDLEAAGVEYSRGGLDVDEYLCTTASNIYACGDAVGGAEPRGATMNGSADVGRKSRRVSERRHL